MGFFATEWQDGSLGAFRMGLKHGGYCLALLLGIDQSKTTLITPISGPFPTSSTLPQS
jgi:hypothetical protein